MGPPMGRAPLDTDPAEGVKPPLGELATDAAPDEVKRCWGGGSGGCFGTGGSGGGSRSTKSIRATRCSFPLPRAPVEPPLGTSSTGPSRSGSAIAGAGAEGSAARPVGAVAAASALGC